MPENDIFPLQPNYPVSRRVLPGVVESTADSGRRFVRLKRAPRFAHELEFTLTTAQKQQLEEWYRRFEKSWFSLRDPVFGVSDGGAYLERYFSVELAAAPDYELGVNNFWQARVLLVDRVGAALFQYPDPAAGHKSVFLEESEGAALAGAWSAANNANAHGGTEKTNPNTNTTDAFQWVYAGYGFRLWARRDTNLGKVEVLLDAVSLGQVDLYAAAASVAQPLLTKLDVPLGLHTVKLKATNTRNAASSANTIAADALEVLP